MSEEESEYRVGWRRMTCLSYPQRKLLKDKRKITVHFTQTRSSHLHDSSVFLVYSMKMQWPKVKEMEWVETEVQVLFHFRFHFGQTKSSGLHQRLSVLCLFVAFIF